jgi:hypothetical protein
MAALKSALAELAASAGGAIDRDAAIALRRIERGARAAAVPGSSSSAFLQLLGRLLAAPGGGAEPGPQAAPDGEKDSPSSLIIP